MAIDCALLAFCLYGFCQRFLQISCLASWTGNQFYLGHQGTKQPWHSIYLWVLRAWISQDYWRGLQNPPCSSILCLCRSWPNNCRWWWIWCVGWRICELPHGGSSKHTRMVHQASPWKEISIHSESVDETNHLSPWWSPYSLSIHHQAQISSATCLWDIHSRPRDKSPWKWECHSRSEFIFWISFLSQGYVPMWEQCLQYPSFCWILHTDLQLHVLYPTILMIESPS